MSKNIKKNNTEIQIKEMNAQDHYWSFKNLIRNLIWVVLVFKLHFKITKLLFG